MLRFGFLILLYLYACGHLTSFVYLFLYTVGCMSVELLSQMSVAYLTGLLQHQRHLRCSEIYAFLEFDVHCVGGEGSGLGLGSGSGSTPRSPFGGSGIDEGDETPQQQQQQETDSDSSDNELDRSSMSRHSALLDADVPYVNEALESQLMLSTTGGRTDFQGADGGGGTATATADRIASQQERWRKLFTNMRVHLKPTAIAIRCRLFEGVLTGADICKWLVQSQYKYAQDSAEACTIGQELLACSLLLPVICGYQEDHEDYLCSPDGDYLTDNDEEDEEDCGGRNHSDSECDSGREEEGGRGRQRQSPRSPGRRIRGTGSAAAANAAITASASVPVVIEPTSSMAMAFSTGAAYLYRYSSKSMTSDLIGSSTLLGAFSPANVVVTRWAKREDRSHSHALAYRSGAHAAGASTDNNSSNAVAGLFELGEVEKQLEANTEGQGFIHYEVAVKHQNDAWSVWRR